MVIKMHTELILLQTALSEMDNLKNHLTKHKSNDP